MNKLIVAAMLLILSHAALSQKTVTLWQCYDSAAVATPLSGEGALYSEVSALRDQEPVVSLAASLDVNGSFVYNSDILDIAQIYGQLPGTTGSNSVNTT